MSEQRANALLDLVEQARAEGDKETEAKAIKAYKMEFGGLSKEPVGEDTLGNKALRFAREATRQIGMTGKNLAQGVVGTAGLVTDTPAIAYEALSGRQAPQGRPGTTGTVPARRVSAASSPPVSSARSARRIGALKRKTTPAEGASTGARLSCKARPWRVL